MRLVFGYVQQHSLLAEIRETTVNILQQNKIYKIKNKIYKIPNNYKITIFIVYTANSHNKKPKYVLHLCRANKMFN